MSLAWFSVKRKMKALMTDEEITAVLQRVVDADGSVPKFAARARLSSSYVYDVLDGKRKPGPSILEALGIEVVRRVKKGTA